jgi:hypothetical protein
MKTRTLKRRPKKKSGSPKETRSSDGPHQFRETEVGFDIWVREKELLRDIESGRIPGPHRGPLPFGLWLFLIAFFGKIYFVNS